MNGLCLLRASIYVYVYIYICVYMYIRNGNQTRRFRNEVYNRKQEEPERKPTKAKQNKANTRTRKQWKHQAIRKQKIKWL